MIKKIFFALLYYLFASLACVCMSDSESEASSESHEEDYDTDRLIADHRNRMNEFIGNNIELRKFVENILPRRSICKASTRREKIYQGYDPKSVEFFVKNNDISRIINSQRMRNYFQQKNYKFLDAAEKFIFLAKNQWIVLAKKINAKDSAG